MPHSATTISVFGVTLAEMKSSPTQPISGSLRAAGDTFWTPAQLRKVRLSEGRDEGRPSIAPERLLRAALIQILFSVRSERQLMEQMQYNLLFRWFVGLGIDDPVWVPTVFSKNRDRLLTTDIARQFLAAILADKAVKPLLSDEHFSVDGTLIKAWASMKSFQPKEAAKLRF